MGFLLRILCFCFVLSGTALAATPDGASPWVDTPQAKVRLISASTGIGGPGGKDEIPLGVHFVMLPGWKIYWRAPGEAGLPPSIDWSGSENLSVDKADMHWFWPTPQRFVFFDLQTVGYSDEVVLPINARVQDPTLPARLRARVDFLICSDICVPQTATLALDLDAGPGTPGKAHHLLERFRSLVPGSGTPYGLSLIDAARLSEGDRNFLHLTLKSDTVPWQSPDAFIHGNGSYDAPRVMLADDGLTAVLTLEEFAAADPHTLDITIVDGERAFEARASLSATTNAASANIPVQTAATTSASSTLPLSRSLFVILGFALIGGLILNVMPCVLPVLAIKALGILKLNQQDTRRIRLSFLASAAGILVSFWGLALAAIVVKMAGIAVGWGIQFQQPAFLIVMILILLAFAANLIGLFEIPLPSWIGGLGGSDLDGARRSSLRSHFFGGMLATLLATPCSAPFLGTAVGFALARGPFEILAVFTALGIGLALPYLAMALWPSLISYLPRPGRWMLTVRRLLGVALLATALWLGSVLAGQLGWWNSTDATGTTAEDQWLPFDRDAIPALVADGKIVFVDVTADWCLTCKVNKTVALGRDAVRERLNQPGIVRMRADWTRPDPAISAYLNTFGRYGIPFNVIYSPAFPAGDPLPELLSESLVIDALDKAAGRNKKE